MAAALAKLAVACLPPPRETAQSVYMYVYLSESIRRSGQMKRTEIDTTNRSVCACAPPADVAAVPCAWRALWTSSHVRRRLYVYIRP